MAADGRCGGVLLRLWPAMRRGYVQADCRGKGVDYLKQPGAVRFNAIMLQGRLSILNHMRAVNTTQDNAAKRSEYLHVPRQ